MILTMLTEASTVVELLSRGVGPDWGTSRSSRPIQTRRRSQVRNVTILALPYVGLLARELRVSLDFRGIGSSGSGRRF